MFFVYNRRALSAASFDVLSCHHHFYFLFFSVGLALSDASRHRPDIGHPQPMEALNVFEAPRFAILRKFATTCGDAVLAGWQKGVARC